MHIDMILIKNLPSGASVVVFVVGSVVVVGVGGATVDVLSGHVIFGVSPNSNTTLKIKEGTETITEAYYHI